MNAVHWISITPNSPIHFGDSKPNFSFLSTKEVVAGSILRGSLADYLIRQGRESEITEYIRDMRFGFFYPSLNPLLLPLPFPTTALECKISPGFKSKDSHGIFDSLLPSVAYDELKQFTEFPVPLTFKCRECRASDGRMEKISGFYIKEGGEYRRVEVKRTSQTKVGISRRRKVSESEMLYSITALKPSNVFVGKILGDTEKLKVLLNALNEVGIGAFTTRGYGAVTAKEEKNMKLALGDVKERVVSFNEKLREVWRDIASLALNIGGIQMDPEGTYFSVDLLSPAVLRDRGGVRTLKLRLTLGTKKIDPIMFSTYSVFIGGWSTAWGLPKTTTYGAGVGSTYVFKVDEMREELYQELENIENEGVGEMRAEGYGAVLICHPFHREVMQV